MTVPVGIGKKPTRTDNRRTSDLHAAYPHAPHSSIDADRTSSNGRGDMTASPWPAPYNDRATAGL